jgi:hypothetical protein
VFLKRLLYYNNRLLYYQSKAYFFNGEVKKNNFTITIENNNMCLVLRPRRFFCIIYIKHSKQRFGYKQDRKRWLYLGWVKKLKNQEK